MPLLLAWRELLNSENKDTVLKMREADYTLHLVRRRISTFLLIQLPSHSPLTYSVCCSDCFQLISVSSMGHFRMTLGNPMTSDGLSAEEQLKTKKSKKGLARLAELEDQLKAANSVLSEPTIQHYQSIYQQADAEVSGLRLPPFNRITYRWILPCNSLISCLKNVSGPGCFSCWIADIRFAPAMVFP